MVALYECGGAKRYTIVSEDDIGNLASGWYVPSKEDQPDPAALRDQGYEYVNTCDAMV